MVARTAGQTADCSVDSKVEPRAVHWAAKKVGCWVELRDLHLAAARAGWRARSWAEMKGGMLAANLVDSRAASSVAWSAVARAFHWAASMVAWTAVLSADSKVSRRVGRWAARTDIKWVDLWVNLMAALRAELKEAMMVE